MSDRRGGDVGVAVDLVFHWARSIARTEGDDRVPAGLRPFLRFSRLPERARAAVRAAVDDDDAFRERAATAIDRDEVDELGWVWLTRPDGWEERLAEAAEAADARDARRRAVAEVRELRRTVELATRARDDAVRRADDAQRTVAELTAERDELADQLSSATDQLAELRAALDAAAERQTALDRRATRAETALGEARRRERELRDAADEAARPGPAHGTAPPDHDEIARHLAAALVDVGEAVTSLRGATRAIEDASDALAASPDATEVPADGPDGRAARRGSGRTARRRAHRSRRGHADDSPEGLTELLRLDAVRVFVDGYNVAMLGWPTAPLAEQRHHLVQGLGGLLATSGGSGTLVDVVFDGDDAAAGSGGGAPRRIRVAYSPSGTTADDVIVERVRHVDPSVPVVVVTDDAELRDRVGAHGANVVGSRALLVLLDRTVPPRS